MEDVTEGKKSYETYVLKSGRFEGMSILEAYREDRNFVVWMASYSKPSLQNLARELFNDVEGLDLPLVEVPVKPVWKGPVEAGKIFKVKGKLLIALMNTEYIRPTYHGVALVQKDCPWLHVYTRDYCSKSSPQRRGLLINISAPAFLGWLEEALQHSEWFVEQEGREYEKHNDFFERKTVDEE